MKNFLVFILLFLGCSRQEIVGPAGKDGHSVIFTTADASEVQCAEGGTILVMAVDTNDSGTLDDTDGNIQTLTICNGLNAAPPTPFTPVAIFNPCGNAPGVQDEVLLKLADGSILASFSDNSNGKNTRFGLLGNGTYTTTDGDNCVFTLNNGNIVFQNHNF